MAVKYSSTDKDLFIQIIGKYPIVEDKKTDAYNIEKKKKAWECIVIEYNAEATDSRTIIQLKRLWDKMKRARKSELAEERRELLATGGGPPKSPPPPKPIIDDLVPHLNYEIDVEDDSDGINLKDSEVDHNRDATCSEMPEEIPVDSTLSTSSEKRTVTSTVKRKAAVLETDTGSTRIPRKYKKTHLDELTEARLKLIKKEEENMDALHQQRLEEARYRKEAARLLMMQEKLKLQRLEENENVYHK